MSKSLIALALLFSLALPAVAQTSRPQIETKKVEGAEGVYIFRNGNHQAMFVVTSDGVIATDPVAYGRPTGGADYVAEIRKVTDKPIKYLIYSHHHYDHIAGGKAFKDAGATIIAHRKARERLEKVMDPATPLPDELVEDAGRTIRLGGKVVELSYVGLNHSDSTLVMRLPQDRLIFLVDLVPVGAFPGLGMIDFYPVEAMDSLKKILAMDWDRMIPGHPGQPGDRLGTKKDVEDQIALQQHASDVVKEQARAGKCWNPAEQEVQFDKYKDLPGYANGRAYVVRRYCGFWGRGT
ncbi:MAG TPA: MBL fold metallo-hydrolase [Burkholderiales bacterium]|nr:MBL fold metallo-hydrolase [Burkholderiales bacterium]